MGGTLTVSVALPESQLPCLPIRPNNYVLLLILLIEELAWELVFEVL